MPGLYILLPIALGLGLVGLFAFFWTMKVGQYDDLDGASMRILIDDEEDRLPEADETPSDPQV